MKLNARKEEFELIQAAKKKELNQRREDVRRKEEGNEWEDIDEHERDVFDKDGYFDIMDQEATIAANDVKLLEKMNKNAD